MGLKLVSLPAFKISGIVEMPFDICSPQVLAMMGVRIGLAVDRLGMGVCSEV